MKGDECKSRQARTSNKEHFDYSAISGNCQALRSGHEERNMFESEYENPIVLGGDYGDQDSPDQEIRCPHCGRIWNGYDTDGVTEWDCTDDAYASSFTYPIGSGLCRVCAFDERTKEQERAYIADREVHVEVLEHLLCSKTVSRITNYDNAAILWDVLTQSEDDVICSWVNDLIHCFICDEMETDFVDWITEGGFERVCSDGRSTNE